MPSFSAWDLNELLAVVEAGGGLELDATLWDHGELLKLAGAAGRSGATLIFRGFIAAFSVEEMTMLAREAPGRIIFVDRDRVDADAGAVG